MPAARGSSSTPPTSALARRGSRRRRRRLDGARTSGARHRVLPVEFRLVARASRVSFVYAEVAMVAGEGAKRSFPERVASFP